MGLHVLGYNLQIQRVVRQGITATDVDVAPLEQSALSKKARQNANARHKRSRAVVYFLRSRNHYLRPRRHAGSRPSDL
jgi:uncharacterized protein (DUF111 family)